MDWAYKAAVTASVVASVMMAARLFDRRVAGALAALPVLSAPALLWLADEQGPAFAADTATGNLLACVVAPAFAWAFLCAARARGAAAALAIACAVAAALAWLLLKLGLSGDAWFALGLALASCAAVLAALGGEDTRAGWVRPLPWEPWLSAGVAAALSVLVSAQAQPLGPAVAGLLTAMPLISGCALVHLRRAGGRGNLVHFVRGYVLGIAAKAVFAVTFAQTVMGLGAAPSMALALLVGATTAVVLARLEGRQPVPRGAGA